MTKTRYKNPLFIVGMPRSGTTLIQGILCNTGYYFPIPETHFFSRVGYALPEKLNSDQREKLYATLTGKSRIEVDKNEFMKFDTQESIFNYIIDTFNKDNCDKFLEKTPRHVFFVPKILSYYPSAKFICMLREPKNVVSSQITTTRIDNKSIIRLAFLYNKIAAAILNLKEKKNVIFIKYEDLTNDPYLTLESLFEFLDMEYDPKFIETVSAPPEIVAQHEFWKSKNINQSTIVENRENKWSNSLGNREANLINIITKKYAKQLGYETNIKWLPAIMGFFKDVRKLFVPRELRRFLSKVHG
jgi:hypothetical protein